MCVCAFAGGGEVALDGGYGQNMIKMLFTLVYTPFKQLCPTGHLGIVGRPL